MCCRNALVQQILHFWKFSLDHSLPSLELQDIVIWLFGYLWNQLHKCQGICNFPQDISRPFECPLDLSQTFW